MRYEFKPSFDKSIKTLSSVTKQEIKELCIHLIDVLSGERDLSVGLGLKKFKEELLGNSQRIKTEDSVPMEDRLCRVHIGWDS